MMMDDKKPRLRDKAKLLLHLHVQPWLILGTKPLKYVALRSYNITATPRVRRKVDSTCPCPISREQGTCGGFVPARLGSAIKSV